MNAYYLVILVLNTIQPYMMNPTACNWKGKPGFFWVGFALVTALWAYFRKPETKTRTSEELDLIFAANLLTRKFRRYRMAELRGEEK